MFSQKTCIEFFKCNFSEHRQNWIQLHYSEVTTRVADADTSKSLQIVLKSYNVESEISCLFFFFLIIKQFLELFTVNTVTVHCPWRNAHSFFFRNYAFKRAFYEVMMLQLYSHHRQPQVWLQIHKQSWCGNRVGDAFSGLWELINQSRLGFSGRGP